MERSFIGSYCIYYCVSQLENQIVLPSRNSIIVYNAALGKATHSQYSRASCCSMLFLYPSSLNHGNEKLPFCLFTTHLGGCHFPRLKCEHPATQWKKTPITSLFTMIITFWNQKKETHVPSPKTCKNPNPFSCKINEATMGDLSGQLQYISLVGG